MQHRKPGDLWLKHYPHVFFTVIVDDTDQGFGALELYSAPESEAVEKRKNIVEAEDPQAKVLARVVEWDGIVTPVVSMLVEQLPAHVLLALLSEARGRFPGY